MNEVFSPEFASFPHLVEYMPTENWASHSGWKESASAIAVAMLLQAENPSLKVRVKHYHQEP